MAFITREAGSLGGSLRPSFVSRLLVVEKARQVELLIFDQLVELALEKWVVCPRSFVDKIPDDDTASVHESSAQTMEYIWRIPYVITCVFYCGVPAALVVLEHPSVVERRIMSCDHVRVLSQVAGGRAPVHANEGS